jgi:hypothetical protein
VLVGNLAAHQGHLYVGETNNQLIRSYSLLSPSHPDSVGSITTPYPNGNKLQLTTAAGVLYYGATDGPIRMVDISDPQNLANLGELPFNGVYLHNLQVFDNFLFNAQSPVLPGSACDIHLVSVASPDPLTPIASLPTNGSAEDVVIPEGKAGLAYVADGNAGLTIVDVSDPLNPFILGNVDTPGFAVEVVVADTLAFVADSDAGVRAISVASSSSPYEVGFEDTPGSAVDLALSATHAYVADSAGGVQLVNIADPTNLFTSSSVATLSATTGIDVAGSIAYAADTIQGLVAINVSDPDNPWIIDDVKGGGNKGEQITSARKVEYRSGRAYVTTPDDGLFVVDVSDTNAFAVTGQTELENTLEDVDLLGIFAYVGSGNDMQLVDIRDDAEPLPAGNVRLPALTRGINADEFYAYVAAGSSGLQICPVQCGFDEQVFSDFTVAPPAGLFPQEFQFTDTSEGYGLSYQWDFGDGVGASTERHPTYSYAQPGDYQVRMIATNGVNADTTTCWVPSLLEKPFITSVVDVPQDQGGYVYVNFHRSAYDTDGLNRFESYTIQRQDAGVWVTVATSGAYAAHEDYSVLAVTQGDGEGLDGSLPGHRTHGRGQLGERSCDGLQRGQHRPGGSR